MMKTKKEFQDLIPPLSPEEFIGLEESIKKEGCREPLILWNDILIDGHNRKLICDKYSIPYETKELEFENENEVKLWMIDNQLNRRNLSDVDKFLLIKKKHAVTVSDTVSTSVTEKLGRKPRKNLSSDLGWSIGKTQAYSQVINSHPEKINDIRKEKTSVWEIIKNDKKKKRKEELEKQKEEIEELAPLKDRYDVIVIDPPWPYGRKYDPEGSRSANPYPEMSIEELRKIDLHSDDDCVLFLWTTHQFIWEAKELMNKWGFEYKAILVWDKEKMGMGNWLRMQCEFCLIGIKGKPIWDAKDIRDIIREPRTKHSTKPESFYSMIDKNFVGKKLDYFNNGRKRKDWDSYGA